ncbi:MAG: nucleotidyltransferase domain-containing protein [Spirochaetales bacterium]|nr:nucleotidyltransferase domain-containing protein [Spirochaetales bacterium]
MDWKERITVDPEILEILGRIKEKYEPEGFIILGLFGSRARGEAKSQSDLDILYQVSPVTKAKYPGLRFFALYARVKADMEAQLGIPVDLADSDALSSVARTYILPEVVHV